MIVSQFAIAHSAYHEVAKHYRLLLTNLAAKGYYFRVTLRSHHAQLDQKIAYSVERPNSFMLDLIQPAGQHRYRGRYVFHVGSHATVRVQLRPFDVPEWQSLKESMDVRGYLELTIPEMATWAGPMEPQGTQPVPVLLHPFQVDWAASTGYRDAAPVTVSSGMAENEIVPDKPLMFKVPSSFELLAAGETAAPHMEEAESRSDMAAFIHDPASASAVVAYLGRAADSAENVEALNALLAEARHSIRVSVESQDEGRPRRKR